jgi:hypothetical protein
MSPRPYRTLGAAGFLLSALLLSAQQGKTPSSDYTLQANTRVVLVDVTVTDQKGQKIHGLRASDFEVFESPGCPRRAQRLPQQTLSCQVENLHIPL